MGIDYIGDRQVNTGYMITTKFYGPTNSKQARVVATCRYADGKTFRATAYWDHNQGAITNHARAAEKVCRKLDNEYWTFNLSDSVGFDTKAYYFVCRSEPNNWDEIGAHEVETAS